VDRRAFVAGTVGLFAAPLAAEAQPSRMARIGWVVFGDPFSATSPGLDAAILRGLQDLRYVEGRNLVIEYRSAEGRLDVGPRPLDPLGRCRM
jgi:putative ABC transport system substrate-binding protein